MESIDVVRALAALAQASRLEVFRSLVVAGEPGLTPGALSESLGVAANTLSFHLKELLHADLITQERVGRNLIYRAQFDRMNAVLAYLTQNCCQGQPCLSEQSTVQPIIPLLKPLPMTNQAKPLNVLFLCTHNSARSILAEALLNTMGQGRFQAFSAGSSPRDNQQPNPLGLQVLQNAGISTEGLQSKSWDVFAGPDAPQMHLIITVCDNAAGEVCPVWPGHPATAHWSYPDPSEGEGSDVEKLEAFRKTLHAIKRRLELFCSLPDAKLEQALLQTSARQLADS
jgi:protein-tyrosine-phosphatase/DNA-binding transcriptional ArsR family regulator